MHFLFVHIIKKKLSEVPDVVREKKNNLRNKFENIIIIYVFVTPIGFLKNLPIWSSRLASFS